MSFNIDGLIGALRTAETRASNTVNSLNANSTATDLTVAGFDTTKFTIFGTAVSNLIKTEGEAKMTPARALARG